MIKNNKKLIINSMKILSLIILATYTLSAHSKNHHRMIRVAVLDSGYSFNSNWYKYIGKTIKGNTGKILRKPKLCRNGHKDFTNTGLNDTIGHGTHVIGTIAKENQNTNYCIIVVKVFDYQSHIDFIVSFTKALRYVYKLNIDIVNYSGGGKQYYPLEYLWIQRLLNKGVTVVVAAGNNGETINIRIHKLIRITANNKNKYKFKVKYINTANWQISDRKPINTYYPAAYDPRIISVQNINKNGTLSIHSNRGGAFNAKAVGVRVFSLLPHNRVGFMSGTSQATAVITGNIVKYMVKK